ncbi:MAG: AAA family ATPase, partial [Desulfobacterales bacterium]|nr:AAA family ATPase [Desulfobacterales bacterium]
QLYKQSGLSEEHFLKIGVQITAAVIDIHREQILHNNISLANIVLNRADGRLNIIDFADASPINENREKVTTTNLQTEPGYLAPERSGRTIFPVDFRSDLYSIGMVFYRLLTGRLPFEFSEPSQLTHAHLARKAIPIQKISRTVSDPLSDIIMKLLEKNPGDRYAEAEHLLQDLNVCLNRKIPRQQSVFTIGKKSLLRDLSDSKKIFGRQKQHRLMVRTWNQVKTEKQIFLVKGAAGVGKTALVQSIDTPDILGSGVFIQGKFDQLQSNVPYRALTHAFGRLIERILSTTQDSYERWQKRLKRALGPNGRLITDLIPALEKVIGPQPPVAPLKPLEEKNRFAFVFHSFVEALCVKDQPVCLFFDDLQWVDKGSLELIRIICISPNIKHLMVAAAYRDNEVNETHNWSKLVSDLKQHEISITRVRVSPLGIDEISLWLSMLLKQSKDKVTDLVEAIFQKTGGNPFFINELLSSIHTKGFIKYVPEDGQWAWDTTGIKRLKVSRSVAGIIRERIDLLSKDAVDILQTASCFGNQFPLKALSIGDGRSPEIVKGHLAPALDHGIVICRPSRQNSRKAPAQFYFAHDSIQQYVYESLSETSKNRRHHRIGKELLAYHGKNADNYLFTIVSQLNAGRAIINDRDGLLELASLNRGGAEKSLESAAYDSALDFYQTGIHLLKKTADDLGNSPWQDQPDLCFSLYKGAAQAAFLMSEYDKMDDLISQVDQNVQDLVKKKRFYEIKISSLYARNRMDEAIDIALEFSKRLGVRFPRKPNKAHIIMGLMKTRVRLLGRDTRDLALLPEMKNPISLAVLRVLSCVTLAAFYSCPNLLPLIVFKSIDLSLKHGNTDASIFGYSGYGFILCGVLNKMDAGYRYGRLAMDLVKELAAKSIETRTTSTFCGLISHWTDHLKDTMPIQRVSFRTGLDTGDHQFAAISAVAYCTAAFHTGVPLDGVKKEMNTYMFHLQQIKQDVVSTKLGIFIQAVTNLSEKSQAPWKLKGELHDIDVIKPTLIQSNDQIALFTQFYLSCMLCVIFNRPQDAVRYADQTREYYESAQGIPDSACFIFYDTIARLSLAVQVNGRTKRKLISQAKANIRLMSRWASYCPANFIHKQELMQAMMYQVEGKADKASAYFRKSVDHASENQYVNDKALACEMAGRFFIASEEQVQAKKWLLKSHECYLEWGALAKARHMEETYSTPKITFTDSPGLEFQSQASAQYFNVNVDPDLIADHDLDVHTVLNASRAIAAETRLPALLKKLIHLIIENSGAQKAFLLLYSDNTLKIEAFARLNPDDIRILESRKFSEDTLDLPVSVVNYTLRTGESIILEDAGQSSQFQTDAYIISNRPVSILCMPIYNKNLTAGILYLENNLMKGVFTKQRLKILNILISQAVVSIENARLDEALLKEKRQKDAAVGEISLHKRLLKDMSAELAMVEEREKKAIADDLHDSVSQTLALGVLNLKRIEQVIDEDVKQDIGKVRDHLGRAVEEIRSLTFQLSPRILYDFGLVAALEWLSDDMRERYGLEVVFMNQATKSVNLNNSQKIIIYRAARELLINVVKHADTNLAFMILDKDADALVIKIKDKGKGFSIAENRSGNEGLGGFGLYSMQDRLLAINGQIRIVSESDKGTEIIIRVPVGKDHDK